MFFFWAAFIENNVAPKRRELIFINEMSFVSEFSVDVPSGRLHAVHRMGEELPPRIYIQPYG